MAWATSDSNRAPARQPGPAPESGRRSLERPISLPTPSGLWGGLRRLPENSVEARFLSGKRGARSGWKSHSGVTGAQHLALRHPEGPLSSHPPELHLSSTPALGPEVAVCPPRGPISNGGGLRAGGGPLSARGLNKALVWVPVDRDTQAHLGSCPGPSGRLGCPGPARTHPRSRRPPYPATLWLRRPAWHSPSWLPGPRRLHKQHLQGRAGAGAGWTSPEALKGGVTASSLPLPVVYIRGRRWRGGNARGWCCRPPPGALAGAALDRRDARCQRGGPGARARVCVCTENTEKRSVAALGWPAPSVPGPFKLAPQGPGGGRGEGAAGAEMDACCGRPRGQGSQTKPTANCRQPSPGRWQPLGRGGTEDPAGSRRMGAVASMSQVTGAWGSPGRG